MKSRLVKAEGGTIQYLDDLPLHAGEAKPITAVFAPSKYTSSPSASVLLYLHGNHKSDSGPWRKTMTIEDYLTETDFFKALLAKIEASGKIMLFVAPSLGPAAEANDIVSRGLDWYLKTVLDATCDKDGLNKGQTSVTVKNLVLAAHSGGGRALLKLAAQATDAKGAGGIAATVGPTLRQVWGFDCLYDEFDVVDVEGQHLSVKDLNPGGCEWQWRNWASRTGMPVFMSWKERMVRNRNLDKLVKTAPRVPNLKVDPPFYKIEDKSDGTSVLVLLAPTVQGQHEDVPRNNIEKRLTELPLP